MGHFFERLANKVQDYKEKEEMRRKIVESMGCMNVAYGKERDYDFNNKYKLIEINKINPYLAYEIRVMVTDRYEGSNRFKIYFAFDDSYNVVKVEELNVTIIGSQENAEDYIEKLTDALEECYSREECKCKMNALINKLKMEYQQRYSFYSRERMRKAWDL